MSFVDGNARQAFALESKNGVAAKDRKVFNGSSRNRIEVDGISPSGCAAEFSD
jgi:hypothetical protein